MAQQEVKSTPMKARPSSMKFQTSFSESGPVNPNSRRHLTLPEPFNAPNNYSLSPAERYVASRSQMLFAAMEQQDISPESPSSITASSIHSFPPDLSFAERMQKWREKKMRELCKKQKHRYVYGTPPASAGTSPTTLGFPFPLPIQSAPRTDIPSSTRTIKKENLPDRPKTNESRRKTKFFCVV